MRRILRHRVYADGVIGQAARKVTGFENAVLQLLCAAAVVTVFTAVRGELSFRLLPSDVFPALLLGLVNAGIGCGCYSLSIGALPAQTVGAILIVGGAIFGEYSRKKRIA